MIRFAGVRPLVMGKRVAASVSTVMAWAVWPSGRKGILISTSV